MNSAHLHIVLVHIPVVLVPFALLLLAIGMWRRSAIISRVACATIALAALFAIPAFLLGEGAEEAIEHLAGVSKHLIEEHEEAADFAFWLTIASGVVSLGALGGVFCGREKFARIAMQLVLLLAIFSSAALMLTAQKGGMIRHPEAFPEQK